MDSDHQFLLYVKKFKSLIQGVKTPSSYLAEQWVYQLMLENNDPYLRNYIMFHMVQQFILKNFKPWFCEANLGKSLENIAIQIHSNEQQQQHPAFQAGDGQMKYNKCQNWIDTIDSNSESDKIECLYKKGGDSISLSNTEDQNFCESISTMTISDSNLCPEVAQMSPTLYQKFIKEYIPVIIENVMTDRNPTDSFVCDEEHKNEFFGFESAIVDQLLPFAALIKNLQAKIKHLETKEEPEKAEKSSETDKTDTLLENYAKKLKKKLTNTKKEQEIFKNDVASYKKSIEQKSLAIKEILDRSKLSLVN